MRGCALSSSARHVTLWAKFRVVARPVAVSAVDAFPGRSSSSAQESHTQVRPVVAMASLLAHDSFQEGFAKSALMILVSEIGDKTFFIAAIMAMRHPQLQARPPPRALVPSTSCVQLLTHRHAGADWRPGRPVGHDGSVRCAGVGSTRAGACPLHCRTGPTFPVASAHNVSPDLWHLVSRSLLTTLVCPVLPSCLARCRRR